MTARLDMCDLPVSGSERAAFIDEELTRFPARTQYIVTAHFFRGVTYRSIAASLNLSAERVYQISVKALRVMRLRSEVAGRRYDPLRITTVGKSKIDLRELMA